MAITTAMKRSCLDDAYDAAKAVNSQNPDLRVQLRSSEKTARSVVAGGALASVSINRRVTEFRGYGPGEITPTEIVEAWRALVDLYDGSKQWLSDCAKYGLDPDQTELNGFPDPAPDAVANPAAVNDTAVYAWMMAHLVAITEARSDYTAMRVGSGMQFV